MPSPRNRVAAVVLVAAVLFGAVACGTSGRTMREPEQGVTGPTRKPPAAGTLATGPTSTQATIFTLSTDQWTPGGPIPELYTCDGAEFSPPLYISAVPEGTVELALVVTDQDANGIVHWLVAGIPPATTIIPEGYPPAGAVEGMSSDGEAAWVSPCPPDGVLHNYDFTLYALGTPSGIVPGQNAESAVAAIEASMIGVSTLTGTYER